MNTSWNRFKELCWVAEDESVLVDISATQCDKDFFAAHQGAVQKSFEAMKALEGGAVANPDENRMVGHYWLRAPEIAPKGEIREAIEQTVREVKEFAGRVHRGEIGTPSGEKFRHVLLVGIGGSALGPQFVGRALGSASDPLSFFFFDNTDPDGMAEVLQRIPSLAHTLVVVISKSGGTKETRNGMLVAKEVFKQKALSFPACAVAVTGEGSALDALAKEEKWLARFPMWDWVGGRTSECSAVGLLPAALQGIDVDALLAGARAMDEWTREPTAQKNPAMLLALAWYGAGKGRGEKDMVVLPYKDRLELCSRYLQQLVMESLGKERDLEGNVVQQGLTVYGNKGSTDQHAFVQQLRDGRNSFFAVFIDVLSDFSLTCNQAAPEAVSAAAEVEPGITVGDYLAGFFQGTQRALLENERESIVITLRELSARSVGMVIALFERAVGLYAELININAYHQPGVEAGKKAAAEVLSLQQRIVKLLADGGQALEVEAIAREAGVEGDELAVFRILERLAENGRIQREKGQDLFTSRYTKAGA